MDRITELYERCIKQTATPEEQQELCDLLGTPEKESVAMDLLLDAFRHNKSLFHLPDASAEAILSAILKARPGKQATDKPVVHLSFLRTAWFRYAAAVILLLGIGAYFYATLQKKTPELAGVPSVPYENNILPGSDKAILTLEDGQEVRLDSTSDAVLAEKGIVNKNALISYSGAAQTNAINTLSTPRGGQYKLRLSDGTLVWLNAASSITYPAVFTGSERTVKITGEAYLEVAKDRSKPFQVQTGEIEVQVLGTSFNINAYPDEDAIKTTLLAGSVRINAYHHSQMLIPGQQLSVSGQKEIKLVKDADIDKVIAWKNGSFNFDGAGLKEVMNQLSRWYDIEVIYEKGIPDYTFGGEMGRDVNLAGVLRGLEFTGVRFRMEEGRRLIVYH